MSNNWLELNLSTEIENIEIISSYFADITLGNHIEGNKIKLYFDFHDRPNAELILNDICDIFDVQDVKWLTLKEENWMKNWMKNFQPVNILNNVLIIPDWDKKRYNIENVIKIHPGMAFGTGHHATTQLIVEHMINYDVGKFDSLLDLGCGSGILSLLSVKMGVRKVLAIDVDHLCEENFYKNTSLNNITDVQFLIQDVHQLKDYNYDVILANIDKQNIIKIINKFEQCNFESILIISGFLYEDKDQVLDCLKKSYADKILKKGEWGSMVIKRKSIEN